MLIRRLKENSIELTEIEPIEAELLRKVPSVCDTGGDSRAETRLFSSPADTSERQFLNDFFRPEKPSRQIWKTCWIVLAASVVSLFRVSMATPG